MKTLLPKLIPLFILTFLGSPCAASTVLTNISGAPTVSQLISGPGGFLSQPIAYGFAFTVDASSEYLFDALTLSFSSGSTIRPLAVELFYSPSGPNTATLLTQLTGPTNPLSGQATWTSPIGLVLDPSETYFVQLTVNAGPASYGLQRTAEPITGDWTFVSGYTKTGANAWTVGAGSAPLMNISATAIPEPAVSGLLGTLLLFSITRRRRPRKPKLFLPLLLMAGVTMGSATAQQVYLDFDQYPVPTTTQLSTAPSPHSEDGLRLTSVVNATTSLGFWIPGPLSVNAYTGTKTFYPFPDVQNRTTTITLTTTNGRRFSLKSLRLHPSFVGNNQSVTFWANNQTGNLWTKTAQTGNALAGTLVTFDSNFENLVSVWWELGPPAGGQVPNRHQISEFLVEFQPQITTTPAFTVNEAAAVASVPLHLTTPRASDTIVQYQVAAGTATLASDFNYPNGGNATGSTIIPAGQTRTELLIPILNDLTTENLEAFTVTFTNPPAGTIFPGAAASIASTINIASDDGVTNFAGWMTTHGLTGNNALVGADPNQDGVSNLESWLCRINPAGPSPAAWLARRATFLLTTTNRPALRITVPSPAPSDVRIIMQETGDLSSWSEQMRRSGFGLGSLWTGPGVNRVTETSTLVERTITLPGSVTTLNTAKQFLRLQYELVPAGGND